MPYMDDDVRARVAELVEEIETSSFRETKWGRRGYSEREVDEFLDYLVDVLFALLSSGSTPGYAGAEPELEPEVVPLEETELHPQPSDETEIVTPPSDATEIVPSPSEPTDIVATPEPEPKAPSEPEPGSATEAEPETVVAKADPKSDPEVVADADLGAEEAPEAGGEPGSETEAKPRSATPPPPWVGPNG